MPGTAKNVIVFLTDQQRWDTSALFGNPLDLSPNFDRMAIAGTHLYHFFTNQPVCGPARAIYQTGQYATRNGCFRNGIPLPSDCQGLGHLFSSAGFQTGYVGKWHLANGDPVSPDQRGGYGYWLASNLLEFVSDAYDTVLYDNDGKAQHLPGYRVDALTDAAIRYIDRVKDDRFFLFLSFLEPHHQNHTDNYPGRLGDEERYAGRWIPPDLLALNGSAPQHLAGYFAMVKRLDEALGRLQDALYSLGLTDDTALLYASDHGCHFKTRNDEYKRSCHEACVRIPGALSGGPFTGGGRVSELVSIVDIVPTLLEAAGIDRPEGLDGRSLVPLVNRTDMAWPESVFMQISEAQVGRSLRTERWKYSVEAPLADAKADPGADEYREEFLYDLRADPHELTNLIGLDAFDEIASQLRQQLVDQIRDVEGRSVTITPAPTRLSGQRSPSIR